MSNANCIITISTLNGGVYLKERDGEAQNIRILSIYDRLRQGHALTKKAEAERFEVTEKTVQRDFEVIRTFLQTMKTNASCKYDRKENVYKLQTEDEWFLRNEEILAIVKVLIESRAFPKADMERLVDKLTDLAQPVNREFIKKLMLNEKHLYVDLQHKQSLFTMLWQLAQTIHTKKLINIHYKKEHDPHYREHTLKPVGLIFSEYYFYVIAYQTKHELNFPTVYRVDRITMCNVTEEHFKIPYSERFEEGEFRKRIQFMHTGELMTIKFRFTGASPQAVLDRLPTARIVKQDDQGTVFEAEVFGTGIKMWLLSQGQTIEVLAPQTLREEMRDIVLGMVGNYKQD